jgi:hypothetical protein
MSICREQGQQGFVLDDDLVEQNLHFTFSASGEENGGWVAARKSTLFHRRLLRRYASHEG